MIDVNNQIEIAITMCIEEQKKDKHYPYLPELIEALKKLRETSLENKHNVATAIGRLVLEDYSFSESLLGAKLLQIADSY